MNKKEQLSNLKEQIKKLEQEIQDDYDLKPCPFCGKDVEIKYKGTHGYDLTSYISCCATMYGDYEYENNLKCRWNKRSVE